jgi:hypothetical protein
MLLYRYLCRWLASFALFLTWLPLVAANEPAHALEKVLVTQKLGVGHTLISAPVSGRLLFCIPQRCRRIWRKTEEMGSRTCQIRRVSSGQRQVLAIQTVCETYPDQPLGANFKEFLQFLLTGSNWADSDFKNAGVDLNDPDPEKATKFLLAKGGASQVPAQLLRPKADAKYWTQVAKGRKVLQKCTYMLFLFLRSVISP